MPMTSERSHSIESAKAPTPIRPNSQAVCSRSFLFLSGRVGMDLEQARSSKSVSRHRFSKRCGISSTWSVKQAEQSAIPSRLQSLLWISGFCKGQSNLCRLFRRVSTGAPDRGGFEASAGCGGGNGSYRHAQVGQSMKLRARCGQFGF